jgi:hypothetical protein
MTQAEEIRKYCIDNHVQPARAKKAKGVFISSGEIHKIMNLSNSYPAVCAALGSRTFEDEAGVKRVYIEGPLNGANTTFVFMFNNE